jgi:hypothetical protein
MKMKIILISLIFFIASCTTNQIQTVVINENLLTQCPTLKLIDPESSIDSQTNTIVENYSLYHQCSEKNKTLIDLYKKDHGLVEKK